MTNTYVMLSVNLHPTEAIGQWVEYNKNITKFCRNYATSVFSSVLTPHDVNL